MKIDKKTFATDWILKIDLQFCITGKSLSKVHFNLKQGRVILKISLKLKST